MKVSLLRYSLVLLPVLFLSAITANAGPITVVFSENFDELTQNLSVSSVGNFTTINGTNVDIVGNPGAYGYLIVAPESGNAVDMAGTPTGPPNANPLGQLQSNAISLTTGAYDLSFDLVGSQRGPEASTTVTLGPLGGPYDYNQTFVLGSNDDTDGIVNTIVMIGGDETAYLTFTANDEGSQTQGALLDNVEITTTPEGSSFSFLLLGGIASLGTASFMSRRKHTVR